MRLLLLLFFLLTIFIDSNAQESTHRQYIKAGNLFFDEFEDYYNAGEFFKKAYKFNRGDSTELSLRIAESAFHSWKLKEAEEHYLKVISYFGDSCNSVNASAQLNLGIVYQRMSKYRKATETFDSLIPYLQECSIDQPDLTHITQLKNATKWAVNQVENPDITIDSLGNINDFRKHELAPVPVGDSLIFTSLYFPEERFHDFEHQIGNIYLNRVDSITSVLLNDLRLNRRDSTVAFMTFNEDMSRMYYSVCHNINTNKRQCRIVTRDRTSNVERTVLGNIRESSTYIHPHWTKNDRIGEFLYFVSDRSGGQGKLDIWYIMLSADGSPEGEPINLSSINTADDELSPFFDKDSQTLYFSSDRITDSVSFGGKDIYKTTQISDSLKFSNIEILEKPYNSSKNDIFYVRSEDRSWLSSNRRAPKNENPLEDGCCYDIFEAVDTSVSNEGQDTIYYKPEFSICPIDPLLTSNISKLYSIIRGVSVDSIAHDSIHGFRVNKELKYQLDLKWNDIDTSFHIAFDSVRGTFEPQVIDITKPVFHRPIIRDYCTSDTIDVFDPSIDLKLIQYDKSSKKVIETTCLDSDGLFRVQPGIKYWLVVNKEGYQIDTFSVTCTNDCKISSCQFFIQQEKVKLTLMTKYICGSINTFLSTSEFTDRLTTSTNRNNSIGPAKELLSSRIYMVDPWETYLRTVNLPNMVDSTVTIHIQTIRNQCDTIHVIEYIDQPR